MSNADAGRYFITYCDTTGQVTIHAANSSLKPNSVDIQRVTSLFSIVSTKEAGSASVIAVSENDTLLLLRASLGSTSGDTERSPLSIAVQSESSLPLESRPKMILPVDPMAWSGPFATNQSFSEQDVLVSVGVDGELAFWRVDLNAPSTTWKCTGKVKTERCNIAMAACSSAKKTVLGKLSTA